MRDLSKTQQLWHQRIEAQQSSGLRVTEFCRREGIHKAGFYAWRRRLSGTPQEGFVELKVEQSNRNAPSSAIEVRLANGRTVMVPEGFDPAHLAKVVAAVEAIA
jgi:hypothetical protein